MILPSFLPSTFPTPVLPPITTTDKIPTTSLDAFDTTLTWSFDTTINFLSTPTPPSIPDPTHFAHDKTRTPIRFSRNPDTTTYSSTDISNVPNTSPGGYGAPTDDPTTTFVTITTATTTSIIHSVPYTRTTVTSSTSTTSLHHLEAVHVKSTVKQTSTSPRQINNVPVSPTSTSTSTRSASHSDPLVNLEQPHPTSSTVLSTTTFHSVGRGTSTLNADHGASPGSPPASTSNGKPISSSTAQPTVKTTVEASSSVTTTPGASPTQTTFGAVSTPSESQNSISSDTSSPESSTERSSAGSGLIASLTKESSPTNSRFTTSINPVPTQVHASGTSSRSHSSIIAVVSILCAAVVLGLILLWCRRRRHVNSRPQNVEVSQGNTERVHEPTGVSQMDQVLVRRLSEDSTLSTTSSETYEVDPQRAYEEDEGTANLLGGRSRIQRHTLVPERLMREAPSLRRIKLGVLVTRDLWTAESLGETEKSGATRSRLEMRVAPSLLYRQDLDPGQTLGGSRVGARDGTAPIATTRGALIDVNESTPDTTTRAGELKAGGTFLRITGSIGASISSASGTISRLFLSRSRKKVERSDYEKRASTASRINDASTLRNNLAWLGPELQAAQGDAERQEVTAGDHHVSFAAASEESTLAEDHPPEYSSRASSDSLVL